MMNTVNNNVSFGAIKLNNVNGALGVKKMKIDLLSIPEVKDVSEGISFDKVARKNRKDIIGGIFDNFQRPKIGENECNICAFQSTPFLVTKNDEMEKKVASQLATKGYEVVIMNHKS